MFGLAGLAKLANLDAFTRAVANYRLLPAAGALPLAGVATRLVALALAALLLAFAAAVAVNLRRGRRIDCGCFTGPGPREITCATVARNLAMSTAAAAVLALTLLCAGRLATAALELTRARTALDRAEEAAR